MEKIFDMTEASVRLAAVQNGMQNPCVASALPDNAVPAMAFVPFQLDRTAYSPEKALSAGTLFTVLDKPFKGRMIGNG